MNYREYIEYHSRGDAGAEERMIASLSSCLSLDNWSKFKLIYYYSIRTPIDEKAVDFWLHIGAKIIGLKDNDYDMELNIM